MRRFANPFIWLTALVVIGVALMLSANVAARSSDTVAPLAGSVVKVVLDGGHGSGVHIGNGFVLTAGHVTGALETVTITTDDGLSVDGEVLWSNRGYDVSLVYVPAIRAMTSPLSCTEPFVGQEITIIGNPGGTEFAKSWGRVAGLGKTGLERVSGSMWRKLVTLDITAAPGVSGGPVFNERGEVVGLLVAGHITSRGAFAYSYMVAGPDVCHVMGMA